MNTNIQHFMELAKRGADSTASRGERVCHKLAAALHDLDDDLMLLDHDAAEGAAALLRAAAGPFESTGQKNAMYKMIEDAGAKCPNR